MINVKGSSRRAVLALVACASALVTATALAPAALAVPIGGFEALPASPTELTSVTVDPATNVIYAQESAGSRFFSYDPASKTWTELAEAPLESGYEGGGSAYLDGKVYVTYGERAEMAVYDIASNSWTTVLNPVGEKIEYCSGCIYETGTADIAAANGLLYLASGQDLVSYEPSIEATTALAEPPQYLPPAGGLQPYEGKLYADVGDGQAGFEAYDIASDEWAELPEAPGGVALGSAVDPTTGTVYAASGGQFGGEGGSLFAYDIATSAWTTVSLPFEVADAGLAYVSTPGAQGVYLVQGSAGTEFARYATARPEADLAVAQSVGSSSVSVGGEATFTVTVTNDGPDEAEGVTLTDALPSNATLVSWVLGKGSCSGTGTLSCTLGALASGASATLAIKTKAAAAGTENNVASVSTASRDADPSNDSASATVAVSPAAPKVEATPQPAPTLPAKPQLAIAHVSRTVKHGVVRVTLACGGKACSGRLTLAYVHGKGKHKAATIFSRASYKLAAGKKKTFTLRLSGQALARLRQAKHHSLRVRARATVKGGKAAHRAARLTLK